jgi:HSP20 family molecular chaperone IbpA
MQAQMIQVMRDQVRAIHRAVTGTELPELEEPSAEWPESDEDVTRRFMALETVARSLPAVAERVPPFSFTPPLDIVAGDNAVIVELAVPGIERKDIAVERMGEELVVRGIRHDEYAAHGRTFLAEIPRGPFRRVIPLPFPVEEEPRIELDRGVLRIHLSVASEGNQNQEHRRTGQ